MAAKTGIKSKKSSEKDLYRPKKTLITYKYEGYKGEPREVEFKKAGDAIAKKLMDMDKKTTSYEVTFRVYRDEDGVLCASGIDHRIYTFGKTYNKLIKNINDLVELFFGVPHTDVTINLKFEAQGNSGVEREATC